MTSHSSKKARRSLCARHRASAKASGVWKRALILGLGLSVAGLQYHAKANTELDVPNGTTDLTTLGATATTDLTFAGTYAPAANTAFTAASALSLGTLDDIDGTQTLSISGAGTITLNGGANSVAPSASDLLYVAGGGTLNVSNGIALTTTAANGNFDVAGTSTLSGIISGTGGFTKTGAGTLTLTGANTFSGGIVISAGTLNVDPNNSANNYASTDFGTGSVTLNSGATLSINPSNNGQYLAPVYSNNFVFNGGTLFSSGANTHLGNSSNTIAINAATTITRNYQYDNSNNPKALYLDGVVSGSSALTISSNSTNYEGSIVGFTNNANTYSGTITVNTNSGRGLELLDGNATTATSGTALQYATVNLTGGLSSVTPSSSIPTVGLAFGSGSTNYTIGALGGSTTFALQNLGGTAVALTLDGNNASTTLSGAITGTGSLIKTGTGALTLSGANTYTGATTVNGGSIQVGVASVTGTSGALGNGSNVTLANVSGVGLNLNSYNTTIGSLAGGGSNGGNLALGSATLTVGEGTGSGTYLGIISGTGGLVKIGTGTEQLGAVNTYSGGTLVSAGTLNVDPNNGGGNSVFGTGTVTVSSGATLSINASGNGQYINNTYANNFIFNGGTLFSSGAGNHLGNSTSTIAINGALAINRQYQYSNGNNPLALYLDGIVSGSSALTISNLSTQYEGSIIGITNNANTYSGTITVNTNSGQGIELLDGNTTTTASGTALQYATVNLTGGLTTATGNVPTVGLAFGTGSTNYTIGALGGSTTFALQNLNSTAVALTVGGNNATTTFSGAITGAGSLTKTGTGTMTLGGANTYTGATTVNGTGTLTLSVANTLATTSGITVTGSGSTLSLTASNALATPGATTSTTAGSPVSVGGQVPVTLGGGTLLRNGSGVSLGSQSGTTGTVGIGMLTLTAASTLDYGTTGVGTLNFNAFSDTGNYLLTINNYTHPTSGTGVDGTDDRLIFNQNLTGLLGDFSINGQTPTQIALGNGEYELTVAAVPEPATWVVGLLCLGAIGLRLYRRSRSLSGQQ